MTQVKEIVTVRRSKSVYGHFTVYLEKGRNRCPIETNLTEPKAMARARQLAHDLKLEIETFLKYPDLSDTHTYR